MTDISMIDKNAHYFVLMHPRTSINYSGVILSFVSTDSRPKWVECEIVEDKYKLEQRYKIELKSLEEGYGKETFYVEDFISLLNSDRIVKKVPNMECVEVSWDEPLTDNVHVTHSAYTLKINKKSR